MNERTSQERLESVTVRLTAASVRQSDPSRRLFDWPTKADASRLAMSEGLLPLSGHEAFATLSDEQRWRLALLEAVNFFSLNLAGERVLMDGLAKRIAADSAPVLSGYLRHFLAEEDAHTAVFARFCLGYRGIIFPDRQLHFPRHYLPGEEEFLFFARVLVFEEVAHDYNRRIAADDDVWKLARDINGYHAADEARHIAFGRALLSELWERYSPQWSDEQRKHVGEYLRRFMTATLRSYVNPDVYRELGLPPSIRGEILESVHWRALSDQSTRRVSQWLQKSGVFAS